MILIKLTNVLFDSSVPVNNDSVTKLGLGIGVRIRVSTKPGP